MCVQHAKIGKKCRIFANMNRLLSKTYIRFVLSALFFALSAATICAQAIKVLPDDPAIKTAVLPNGLKCYIVTNPTLKGIADFALVQNVGTMSGSRMSRGQLVEMSREGLASQMRLLAPSVQDFFTSLGAVPGREGFVNIVDDATVYHFRNVNISAKTAALDSCLLVLTGIVEKAAQVESDSSSRWFTPSDHAIIISGDVDAAKTLDKLRMLSYMLRSAEPVVRRGYVWNNVDQANVSVLEEKSSCLSAVTATWRLPRTPRERMNSVQPLVVEKYMRSLALISRDRIERLLKSRSIPYAEVNARYVLPENHLDDESFSITVKVESSQMLPAIRAIAAVTSSLVSGKIEAMELKDAVLKYFEERLDGETALNNANYVRRCVSAFLYNESLTSTADQNKFMMTRAMSEDKELSVFRSIASSSLSGQSNLSLECRTSATLSEEEAYEAFRQAWSGPFAMSYEWGTPSLATSQRKIKVSSNKKEYLTGGSIWTMANGLRVIVKKTDAKDVVNWSLILNGGYGNIPNVESGEALYFSEYLDMCRIGGVSADVFRNAVRRRGMSFDMSVSHSSTILKGRVPDDALDYLVRILMTVMNDSKPDMEAFEYRRECEELRLKSIGGTLEERVALMDSLLCSGYKYSARKAGLSPDFMRKGWSFFEELSGRMDTGVLLLVGDVDESTLKDALVMFSEGFKVSARHPSRPVVSYQPISGTVNVIRPGEENSVDMVLSAPLSLTTQNYYTSEIVMLCLRRVLSQVVTEKGMHLRLNHKCSYYPHERVSLMLSLREASVDGFATGVSHDEPMEALTAVRGLLKDLTAIDMTDAELASYKALLKQRIKRRSADPSFWQQMVELRYVEGKDFYTGYEAKIDAITRNDVRNLLMHLSEGSRVEYVIERE